ncbi:MAG: NrtA/SsuA/CpmA family ABC transporter substrate-binding protein, partial [Telluria sp.]
AGATQWWPRQAAPLAVRLALPVQINSAPVFVGQAQGLFAKAGVSLHVQPFLLGKDALKAVIDGNADLAIVADTPFMFAVLGGNDVAAVASISEARRALAIVARRDHGIATMAELKGKTVGLTMGTNSPYFLEATLQANRMHAADLSLRDMQVDAYIAAFKGGEIDAAVVFQPYLAQLQRDMGQAISVFFGEDVYAFRFLLVGQPAYIQSHPQEVQRVLNALIQAKAAIHADPTGTGAMVAKAVGIAPELMATLFDPQDYDVTLDQGLLLALDDQTRWAIKSGLAKPGQVPNYLHHLAYRDLEAVSPSAVRIVR